MAAMIIKMILRSAPFMSFLLSQVEARIEIISKQTCAYIPISPPKKARKVPDNIKSKEGDCKLDN